MKQGDRPSEYFQGACLRAFYAAECEGKPVTASKMWDYVVMECLHSGHGAFETMFEWDTSQTKSKNRIGTIQECIQRGYIPALEMRGSVVVCTRRP
jgi:hypothetical protein